MKPLFVLLIAALFLLPACTSSDNSNNDNNNSHAANQIEPENETKDENDYLPEIEIEPVEVALTLSTPIFRQPLESGGFEHDFFQTEHYALAESVFIVNAKKEDWLSASDYYYGQIWFPAWYTSTEAAESEWLHPVRLTLNEDSEVYLAPESNTSWSLQELEDMLESSLPSHLVTTVQWRNWHGVVLPPEERFGSYKAMQPVLLWVEDSDVQENVAFTDGILAEDTPHSLTEIQYMTDLLLYNGMKAEEIASLLGKPDIIEQSRNLNYTGEPLHVGENWRYERQEGQLVVTLTEEEALENYRWILPLEQEEQRNTNFPNYYDNSYEFRALPIVSSEPLSQENWRSEGELAIPFLWRATDEALLIHGHDGGFSGMHYDSNFYAIHPQTGEKLWQIDAGYNGVSAVLSEDKKYVTVFTSHNKEDGEQDLSLQKLRIHDGAVQWETSVDQGEGFISLVGTQDGSLITFESPYNGQKTYLTAWNEQTGTIKWEKEIDRYTSIINRTGEEPYILLQSYTSLLALQPANGELVWEIDFSDSLTIAMQPNSDIFIPMAINPFEPYQSLQWFHFSGMRFLVDIEKGELISEYSIESRNNNSQLNERYLLINEPQFDVITGIDAEEDDLNWKTILYDAFTEQALWEQPGIVGGASLNKAGDTIYVKLDGIPSAIELSSGKLIWQTETEHLSPDKSFHSPVLAFFDSGDELLMVDGYSLYAMSREDGTLLHRIPDVYFTYMEHATMEILNTHVNIHENMVYISSGNGRLIAIEL